MRNAESRRHAPSSHLRRVHLTSMTSRSGPLTSSLLYVHLISQMYAQRVLSTTAWGYYRSAGDDEYTIRANSASFKRWWFRPRILNRISGTDLSSTMLGMPVSLPIFIAPAALARLGHPDGEMNLTKAAGKAGIVQGVRTPSPCDRIILHLPYRSRTTRRVASTRSCL
jgi:isopentenyl diphosphate isomerase/L-lactate dehydrogenase-like FMN-dependent dehydrogenase